MNNKKGSETEMPFITIFFRIIEDFLNEVNEWLESRESKERELKCTECNIFYFNRTKVSLDNIGA